MDAEYDLVLRDPEGGILQRWPVETGGYPVTGLGNRIVGYDLITEIVLLASADMKARRERGTP